MRILSGRYAFRAFLLLSATCGGSSAIPYATRDQLSNAQARWPDTTSASLDDGRELFVARCSGCHPLPSPERFGFQRWHSILDTMGERARLTGAERELVLRYLTAVGRRD